MPRIEPAFGLYVKLMLTFGLIFQMPTLVLFLARMGIITARFLIRNMKYAILIMFIVGAVLSPGTDPVGQVLMAGPMFLLYLISIGLAWALRQEEGTDRRGGVRATDASPLRRHRSAHCRSSVFRFHPQRCGRGAAAYSRPPRPPPPHRSRRRRTNQPASARGRSTRSKGIDDVRVIDVAFDALRDGDIEVVIAALGVLRRWVAEETGTRLLDAITAITVDRSRDARVRVAALAALSELPEHLVRPIRDQAPPPESAGPSLDDPVAVREWIQAYGAGATLSTLHELVTRTREREHAESSSRLRSEWLQARGRAHQALAKRRQPRRALRPARDVRGGHGRAAAVVPLGGRGHRRCELPRTTGPSLGGSAARIWTGSISSRRRPPRSCGARSSPGGAQPSRSCGPIFQGSCRASVGRAPPGRSERTGPTSLSRPSGCVSRPTCHRAESRRRSHPAEIRSSS